MDISKHVITTVSVHLFTEKCCLALVYAGTGMRGCRVSHSAISLQKDLGRYLWTMVSKGDTSAGKASAEGTLVTPLFHPELQLSITPLLLGWLVSQPSTIHLGNFLPVSPCQHPRSTSREKVPPISSSPPGSQQQLEGDVALVEAGRGRVGGSVASGSDEVFLEMLSTATPRCPPCLALFCSLIPALCHPG